MNRDHGETSAGQPPERRCICASRLDDVFGYKDAAIRIENIFASIPSQEDDQERLPEDNPNSIYYFKKTLRDLLKFKSSLWGEDEIDSFFFGDGCLYTTIVELVQNVQEHQCSDKQAEVFNTDSETLSIPVRVIAWLDPKDQEICLAAMPPDNKKHINKFFSKELRELIMSQFQKAKIFDERRMAEMRDKKQMADGDSTLLTMGVGFIHLITQASIKELAFIESDDKDKCSNCVAIKLDLSVVAVGQNPSVAVKD